METIREIIEFSHDGYGQMWYPFAASLEENNTTISAEYYFEISDLLTLMLAMFGTNNHQPEIMSNRNAKMSRKHLVGLAKKTICTIRFRTEKSEYILHKCFIGHYSTEARLQKVGSTITYHGQNAIQTLGKFNKPIIIDDGGLYLNGSLIFKPLDSYSRSCMVSLSNNWARMIGLGDARIELDFEGRWSTIGESGSWGRGMSARNRIPSPLRLLTNLAQAVMKKRTYGMCAPVFTPFNVETLNEFEAIAMMDLVRNVCKEENIQFIVGINSTSQTNTMINAIETPRLSIYET